MCSNFHGFYVDSKSIKHNRTQVIYEDDLFDINPNATKNVTQPNINVTKSPQRKVMITNKISKIQIKAPLPPQRIVKNHRPLQLSAAETNLWRNAINNQQTVSNTKENRMLIYSNGKNYHITNRIGSGTYGQVYKGYHVETSNVVAIKRILCKNNHKSSYEMILREVDNLKLAKDSENVMQLLEVYKGHHSPSAFQIDLVFEYCPYDLQKVIQNKSITFNLPDIKCIMSQLFSGLEHIHKKNILHRDIKTENILLTNNGILKIADFGLSRKVMNACVKMDELEYTNNVVTLWYRAPEIILGARDYNAAVDLWSSGCVLGEFWTRGPILPGKSDNNQLQLISQLCGSIKPTVWSDCVHLPMYQKIEMPPEFKRNTREYLINKSQCNDAGNLFDCLLELDPKKRITASTAQNHDFFWLDPLPSESLNEFMELLRNLSNII